MTVLASSTSALATSASRARTERLVAAFTAAALGLLIVWGVGFSNIAQVHNAAHDTRHSTGFPCH